MCVCVLVGKRVDACLVYMFFYVVCVSFAASSYHLIYFDIHIIRLISL